MLKTIKLKYLLIALLLVGFMPRASAQVDPDRIEQGREMLAEKDIPEDEVRRRLEARGIDPDNIPPEKLPEMEGILQEIIAEIEAEQNGSNTTNSKVGFRESTVVEKTPVAEAPGGADTAVDINPEGPSLDELASETISNEIQARQNPKYVVFGQHIFKNKSIKVYRTTESAFTPDNYILDAGDHISITIFGQSQADVAYEIEADGFIRPSNMPKIYLKGMSLGKAKVLLRNRFRQAYSFSSEQISISVKTARTLSVNIFGEVEVPGTYSISALNTALNAIMAAGGVKNSGSVRRIQIVRNGKTRYIDLYKYITNPNQNMDMHLENGDILYVPPLQKTVTIEGAVRRPGNYEIIDKEGFNDLLELANGFKPNADQELMNSRSYDGNKVVHRDIELSEVLSNKKKIELNDKDVYFIRSYKRSAEDFVVIQGPVSYPGTYAYQPDMRISDLLDLGEVQDLAREDIAYLIRENRDGTRNLTRVDLEAVTKNPESPANEKLEPKDVVILYAKAAFKDAYNVSISGAVRLPGTHFWSENAMMTVADLIIQAGGVNDQAAEVGYVIHTSINNPELRTYDVVNVKEIIDNPASSANFKLKRNDQVYIFSSSTFTDDYTVEVIGAVREEISVPFSSNLGLRDLITMAGGLRTEAANNRIDVYRYEFDKDKASKTIVQTVGIDADYNPITAGKVLDIRPGDVIAVRYAPEYELMRFVELRGEVRFPGQYAILSDNETLADVIERAGGLTAEAYTKGAKLSRIEEVKGYVVLKLDKAMSNQGGKHNITLKDGDLIEIPKTMDYVSIEIPGTLAKLNYVDDLLNDGRIHLTFMGKKSARWYINNYAGGFSKRAIKKDTRVMHANGQIKRTKRIMFIKFYPKVKRGSTVLVNEKPPKDKDGAPRQKIDRNEVFSLIANTLAITSTALTTAILAKNL